METFALRNSRGVRVQFTAYGGSIVSIDVPDRNGRFADVVLGYDSIDGYVNDRHYLGPLIGRYANRIARGRFTLGGQTYQLTVNDGVNHLHGGRHGFHKVSWDVSPFTRRGRTGAVLRHTSVAGDEGYPGTLTAAVTYTLTDDDELIVEYEAQSDEPTPASFTQHSYYNLAGHAAGTVREHELTLGASHYTPVDSSLIPTGEVREVRDGAFDFTSSRIIAHGLACGDEQIRLAAGYDHNFVLDRHDSELAFAARLHDPASGRTLEIYTTEPGIQFYSGQALGGVAGKGGVVYAAYAGVALETQHFPDSPNQSAFPSTILRPGATYRSRSVYRFTVQ